VAPNVGFAEPRLGKSRRYDPIKTLIICKIKALKAPKVKVSTSSLTTESGMMCLGYGRIVPLFGVGSRCEN